MQTRRLSAGVGVLLLLALGLLPEAGTTDRLAQSALIVLSLGIAAGWLQLLLTGRVHRQELRDVQSRGSKAWPMVIVFVAVAAGLVVQTWFRPGTTISGGDLNVPNGTAWLSRVFEPWSSDGSTLGEASDLSLRLPWGAVLGLVHAFGGEPALAQRIWYTTLFVGAGLSVLGLLASLRLSPLAALVGSAVYLLNPYVLTWVNTLDTYLVALGLIAAIPAALIAASSGRL